MNIGHRKEEKNEAQYLQGCFEDDLRTGWLALAPHDVVKVSSEEKISTIMVKLDLS